MLARKSLFARVAASACFCATRSSSTSAASCWAFFRCVSCASSRWRVWRAELGLGALALDADGDRVGHRRHRFQRRRREFVPREDRHARRPASNRPAADSRRSHDPLAQRPVRIVEVEIEVLGIGHMRRPRCGDRADRPSLPMRDALLAIVARRPSAPALARSSSTWLALVERPDAREAAVQFGRPALRRSCAACDRGRSAWSAPGRRPRSGRRASERRSRPAGASALPARAPRCVPPARAFRRRCAGTRR